MAHRVFSGSTVSMLGCSIFASVLMSCGRSGSSRAEVSPLDARAQSIVEATGVSVVSDGELFANSVDSSQALLLEMKFQVLDALRLMGPAFREVSADKSQLVWKELSSRQVAQNERKFVGDGSLGLFIVRGNVHGELTQRTADYNVSFAFEAKDEINGEQIFRYRLPQPMNILEGVEIKGSGQISIDPRNSLPLTLAQFLLANQNPIAVALQASGEYRSNQKLAPYLSAYDADHKYTGFMKDVLNEMLVPMCEAFASGDAAATQRCHDVLPPGIE